MDRIPSSGYSFVGIFGLLDPPRERVGESIRKAHTAGVRVAMLIGDHATTARSIARQVHIISTAIRDGDIHTLRLAQNSLGRAVMEVMQGGHTVSTHLLGQAKTSTEAAVVVREEPRTYVANVDAYVKSRLVSKAIEPRLPTTVSAAVITGNELRVFDDFLWDWALRDRYLVFARTTPEQRRNATRWSR